MTITVLASAARDSSASGTSVDRGSYAAANLVLSVSSASGTAPALVVYIDTSSDGSSWTEVNAFASRSTSGEETIAVAGLRKYVRARWTTTAGASFTFGVAGEQLECYANSDDLSGHGIPAAALASKTPTEKAKALVAASEEMRGRFNNRFTFPLVAWGEDLRKYTARIAAVDLLFSRGVNPDAPDLETFSAMRSSAEKWGNEVGQNKVSPPGIVDSTPLVDEAEPQMYTNAKRGW